MKEDEFIRSVPYLPLSEDNKKEVASAFERVAKKRPKAELVKGILVSEFRDSYPDTPEPIIETESDLTLVVHLGNIRRLAHRDNISLDAALDNLIGIAIDDVNPQLD